MSLLCSYVDCKNLTDEHCIKCHRAICLRCEKWSYCKSCKELDNTPKNINTEKLSLSKEKRAKSHWSPDVAISTEFEVGENSSVSQNIEVESLPDLEVSPEITDTHSASEASKNNEPSYVEVDPYFYAN